MLMISHSVKQHVRLCQVAQMPVEDPAVSSSGRYSPPVSTLMPSMMPCAFSTV